MSNPNTPVESLRRKLIYGRGRWLLAFSLIVVWSLDNLLSAVLLRSNLIEATMLQVDQAFEALSGYLFLCISLILVVALLKPFTKWIVPVMAIYMTFAILQVIANVMSMVLTAHVKSGVGLTELWDIAAVYAMSVVVFTMVYVFLDITVPGGAFLWPSREGEVPPEPNLLDYLFISLNVNSTYGPTSEAVMSRGCKLVMSLQTLLSLMMLTVLIARAVGATN